MISRRISADIPEEITRDVPEVIVRDIYVGILRINPGDIPRVTLRKIHRRSLIER